MKKKIDIQLYIYFYFNCIVYYKKEYNDFYENLIIKIFALNLLKIFL